MKKYIDFAIRLFSRIIFHPYYLFFKAERILYKNLLSKYAYGKILDVGCGSCNYKEFLLDLKKVKNYIGVDYPIWCYNFERSKDTADKYGILGKIAFRDSPLKANIYGDGCLLGVKSEAIDMVLSIGVLEHVFKPLSYIKEIARVTKKGGFLFLTIPFLYEAHGHDDASADFYRWTKAGIELMLEENGFRIKRLLCYGKSGTMFSQLINSFIIKKIDVYNSKKTVFFKICQMMLMIPFFFIVNIIGSVLDLLKEDYSYTAGFCIIAVRV